MVEEIVRCPYCVLENEFRPMLSRLEGWFICNKCGHSANPQKAYYKCSCRKREELHRVA